MMLLAGIGGALGATSRYLVGIWIGKRTGTQFPYPTMFINIAGSFLLGILAGMKLNHSIPEWCWLLVGVGFCGAFTTFSTFGYEALQLLLSKKGKQAILYIVASTIFCTISAYIGIMINT
ncbi:fluoride efflux transporter CrcB [Bacillus sp. REN16]|uniref:fluoride efflux transporter CrcB n=1 Tax=Bacillus sp. REN16 TaxID=2887296 RepID=UPI001E3FD120|nr:fluoride efflux transporter CrcB [Bacillus sp. REN16]MCC3355372.1 fluoride efflux transporter CrcB [Bacillus sp. REN16]